MTKDIRISEPVKVPDQFQRQRQLPVKLLDYTGLPSSLVNGVSSSEVNSSSEIYEPSSSPVLEPQSYRQAVQISNGMK